MSSAIINDERHALQYSDYIQQVCTVSGIALMLFEICITADLELAYIWARGRARMIVLFVALRHVQLVSLILGSITLAFPSPERCRPLGVTASIMDVIPYISWAIFLGWRAYALSSKAIVGLLVFICSASFAVPSLMVLSGTRTTYAATPAPGCIVQWYWAKGPTVTAYVVDVSRPLIILAEAVVLVMTCRATYREWRSSRRTGSQGSLPTVLYRNGVMCFAVGFVLHIVAHLVTLLQPTRINSYDTVTIFRDVLITIVSSRFILQLAMIGEGGTNASQGAPTTRGVLTTEVIGDISGISSQWSLDSEYNGRGFDKDIDIDTFELKQNYEA